MKKKNELPAVRESITGNVARVSATTIVAWAGVAVFGIYALLGRFIGGESILFPALILASTAIPISIIWLVGRGGQIEARQRKILELERRVEELEERVANAEAVEAFEERLAKKEAEQLKG
ncbi:MAG: hypothetical protein AAGA58_09245 [Verrucomicrobiota bacterium]